VGRYSEPNRLTPRSRIVLLHDLFSVLYFNLRLDLPSSITHSEFQTKMLHAFLISPFRAKALHTTSTILHLETTIEKKCVRTPFYNLLFTTDLQCPVPSDAGRSALNHRLSGKKKCLL
jgi:hypothetical protein